jgi:hypothetical protein
VLGFNSKKPRERFYLLPGQGGKNFYRKQQRIMRWTISVAVVFGVILAVVMWCQARVRL